MDASKRGSSDVVQKGHQAGMLECAVTLSRDVRLGSA